MAWKLLYHHDKFGKLINGSFDSLVSAVKNGFPIRIVMIFPNGMQQVAFEPVSVFTLDVHNGSRPAVSACHTFLRWSITLGSQDRPTDESSLSMAPNELLTLGCSTSGHTAFNPVYSPSLAVEYQRMDLKWHADV